MSDKLEIHDRRSKLSATKRALLEKILSAADAPAAATIIPARNELKPAPLSFGQRRLWFLEQLTPGTSAYNISRKVTLTGELSASVLRQTLKEIVRRHESLRTTFRMVDGEPAQWVEPAAEFEIRELDLTNTVKQSDEVERLTRRHALHVFGLSQGPLLRATLLKLSERRHVLLLTTHHIITDGWSIDLFFHELAALYEAFATGRSSPLPELPIQYADFAAWQRQQLQNGSMERQAAYWKAQLSEAQPNLELLADKPRSGKPILDGARQRFTVSHDLTHALRQLAQDEGVTLFMLLLAAFNVLLYRYSGQDDISIGVPAADRSRKELEGLIGFFVNTLVLRTPLRGDMSFRKFLAQTRNTALSGFAHRDLPFEQLVEMLPTKRDISRTPLFQTMFALHAAWFDRWTMTGVEGLVEVVNTETSQFELSLDITETGNGLRASFEYSTELFHDETITRMSRHCQTLLQAIVDRPDRRLDELPLLNREEREQLLLAGVPAGSVYSEDRYINQLFEAQAASTPDAIAISFGNDRLTYRQLDEQANRLARYLLHRGVRPGQAVALCVDQKIEMGVGILGILKAGAAYVPLDPGLPRERIAFMVQDTSVSVAVTQEKWTETLSGCGLEFIRLDADRQLIDKQSNEAPAVAVGPENVAYIIFTSGSTGQPKGVLIPHRAVVNHSLLMARELGLEPGDRCLQFVSLSFDIAVEELFPTWFSGACVVTKGYEAISTADLLRLLAKEEITVVNLPTAYWHVLVADLDRSGEKLPAKIRVVIAGGEKALTERLETWLKNTNESVLWLNGYGPTETTVTVTVLKLLPGPLTWTGPTVPIGKPLRNTHAYILDTRMEPVPVGVPGELYLGGLGLAHGYVQRPELTAQSFIPNPFAREPGTRLYRTGDRVRYLPDMTIEVLGRMDQQVKIRGYRIEPEEIEAVLGAHDAVRQAAVVAHEYAPDEHRLIAYFVTSGDGRATAAELKQYLRDRLPEYMVPSSFIELEAVPLTTSNKVDRKALVASDLVRLEREDSVVGPRTPTEQVLGTIWSNLLKLSDIGIHDNFFELGGHSLLAMQLIALVQETHHVELPLRTLFEHPTVAAFAQIVEAVLSEDRRIGEVPIKPVEDSEQYLSFNQEGRLFRDWWEGMRGVKLIPFQNSIGFHLTGTLNRDALERAFSELIRRHAVLRATFQPPRGILSFKILHPLIDRILSLPATQKRLRKVSKKGAWKSSFFRQTIKPPFPFKLNLVDLRELSATQQEAEVLRLVTEEANNRIDYTKDIQLKTLFIRLSDEEHVLVIVVHHLGSDGWSFRLLLQELAQYYQAFCNNEVSPISEPPFQYSDFAYWQREQMQGEVMEKMVSYWEKRYAGFPLTPELPLPFELPESDKPTYEGTSQILPVPGELYVGLQNLTRQLKVTMYMLMLAAFLVLLARYTGRERLSLFVAAANRNRVESQSVIGWFANAQVFNFDLSNTFHFVDIVERVRTNLLDDYPHQQTPYSLLFGELLKRTPDYKMPSKLFGRSYISFDLRVDDETAFHLPGVTVRPIEIPTLFGDELAITAIEAAGQLTIKAGYPTAKFDKACIAPLLTDFEGLLREISIEPATRWKN